MSIPAFDAGSITGVVLAGGRGTRMRGADKAWVIYEGRPLIEHVLARLRPQLGEIVISANRNLGRYRAMGHRVVADDAGPEPRFLGPLAGMLAGLRAARGRWAAFVPCDAPDLPSTLVAALAHAALAQERAALACAGGRRQPVFCLLPVGLVPTLEAAIARGERRPDDFLRQVGAAQVPFEDTSAFANVNSLEQAAMGAAPDEPD